MAAGGVAGGMIVPDMTMVTRKRHLVRSIVLPLLLMGCAEPDDTPQRVVEVRTTLVPMPRGDALLQASVLGAHNAARAAAGVAPLEWDETLAASAQAYARTLARTGRFEHAEQPQGPGHEGETLWTGTRDAYSYTDMTRHWIAERSIFTNGPTPMFSTTGRWQDAAHYAQIVWRGSTRVGCAMASDRTDDYLVCRYSPPGNVVGERAL